MIAVLYKVDYAVQNGYNNPACTSIPCGWNQSTRKDVEPRKIIDLNLEEETRLQNLKQIVKDW